MKHDQDHHVPGAMELFLICLGRTLGCIGVSLFSRKRRSFYSFFLINKNGCEEDSSSRLFNGDVRILYDTKSTSIFTIIFVLGTIFCRTLYL